MIGTIRGKLIIKSPSDIIVEASGVGYQLHVPLTILSEMPQVGEEVFLYVYTHVREDAIHLYGFSSEEQKRAFVTLLGITGIGPKVALNVISGINHDEFLRAVEAEDVTMLTRIPGLGKKTAHRIVLELKGKLPQLGEAPADRVYEDTLSALVNLGYRKADALEALELARKKGYNEIEPLLREALKFLTGEGNGTD
jgi:Holliday junction DNA helicase RuvA